MIYDFLINLFINHSHKLESIPGIKRETDILLDSGCSSLTDFVMFQTGNIAQGPYRATKLVSVSDNNLFRIACPLLLKVFLQLPNELLLLFQS